MVGDINNYDFINYDANHIELNGDDWSDLKKKFSDLSSGNKFTIVHIGDSHIQADVGTGTTRVCFQKRFGNGGRGLIVPFRLAGTNQPDDYTVSSTSSFTKATLMRMPWPTKMGFTGVSLFPETTLFTFHIKVKEPVRNFVILHDGEIEVESVIHAARKLDFSTERTPEGLELSLPESADDFEITLKGAANIFGFNMKGTNDGGVVYHAIGNNGATYASYNGVKGFGERVATLNPDLVIISLGTNEAFGRVNREVFRNQIDALITKVKRSSPDAKILITTPSECQKSTVRKRYVGKKKRRRAVRTRTYAVNPNVALIADEIREYAIQNNIPLYDFYNVAGGEGASTKWVEHKLLSADRIHRSRQGYKLDGTLIYQALAESLDN